MQIRAGHYAGGLVGKLYEFVIAASRVDIALEQKVTFLHGITLR
jgi:hypothetical protein